jgi:hypothetical protein
MSKGDWIIYIKKVLDQIKGSVNTPCRLWEGSLCVKIKIDEQSKKLVKEKQLG